MAKGNDGSAARRRITNKLLCAAGCSLVIVVAIVGLGGGGIPIPATTTNKAPNPVEANHPPKERESRAAHRRHEHKHERHPQQGQQQGQRQGQQGQQRQQQRRDDERETHDREFDTHPRGRPFGGRGQREGDDGDDASGNENGNDIDRGGRPRPFGGRPFGGRGGGGDDGDDEPSSSSGDAREFRKGRGGGAPRIANNARQKAGGDGDDDHGDGAAPARQHQRASSGDDARAAQYTTDLLAGKGDAAARVLDGILDGSTHLVGLKSNSNLTPTKDGSYEGVTGTFCKLDFALHKKDPSKYPMFRFLLQASPDCERANDVSFDLHKVAYLARHRDQQQQQQDPFVDDDRQKHKGPKVLNVTAVAFHESRCGSTLVANSMIAMDPEKHRAYSESAPPVYALHVCGERFDRCHQEQAATILRDTIYLMSRTDDPKEERVFFKFQSITSKAIPTFQMAFPAVPWMYVYRDPVQVMMSHVKDDPKLKRAICTKTRRYPPKEIKAIAKRHGRSGPDDLEPAEYCAAHLAQLTEAAVNSLNDRAIPVPYDRLPSMMWDTIFPKVFGRPLEPFEIENLTEISKSYSKQGKGKNAEKQGEFHGDSEQKEKKASDAIRRAADEFLKESFDTLTAFDSKVLK